MDYEQEYKDALERAKDVPTMAFRNEGEVLRYIFPELAESEDEGIRKEIIEYFWDISNQTPVVKESLDCRRWIAYLEKQKEPKSTIPSRNEIMGIWELGNIWKDCPEEREGLTQLHFIQKHWYDKNDYNSEEPKEKQKEQKPIQADEEKEYIRTLKSLISDLFRDSKVTDISFYQKIYDWLDYRHTEQKPAEKPNGKMVLDSYSRGYNDGYRSGLIDKNTPGATKNNPINPFDTKLFQDGVKEGRRLEREDMLKEQKPAEWSAYDEKTRNSIIKAVEEGRLLTLVQLHWLKSLPSQIALSKWKPSEEQIEALKYALGDGGVFDKDALKSLYNSLKKLM